MSKLFAFLIISIAHAQAITVNPSNYLVFPTFAQAQARSQQQCQAVCDPGDKVTKYWWNVVPLTDGTAAVEIQPSGYYGKSVIVGPCAVGCGLTTIEQSQLQTATQLGNKLPAPNPGPVAQGTPQ